MLNAVFMLCGNICITDKRIIPIINFVLISDWWYLFLYIESSEKERQGQEDSAEVQY